MKGILIVLFSYLLGSIPTGLILAKIAGAEDPRTRGSGNIGATNVLRTAGKTLGVLTLVGDIGKGALPVAVAKATGGDGVAMAAGLAAFLGHLFPLYLRFRGGKGVATAIGIYLMLAPLALLIDLAVFLGGVVTTRMVSVGSLMAALLMPLIIPLVGYPTSLLWVVTPMSLLIIWRHRGNIQRILRGEEHKIFS